MSAPAPSPEIGRPERGETSNSRYAALIVPLLLVLGTLLLYNPALRNGFVIYDDPQYVTVNAHVAQGITWHNIVWAATTTEFANWHPLTWLSHMAAVSLFGMNPLGHHLTNEFLHAINVALLFLVLRAATGLAGRSALVAALFAVHPLNVESVAWVSERKGLLCFLFSILALWAWLRYTRSPGIVRYLEVVALFACALMSKPMAITLPFLLLLFDFWPLQRFTFSSEAPGANVPIKKILIEKIPLALMSVASAVVTVIAQKGGGAMTALTPVPLRFRLGNAVYSCLLYLGKGIWPARLAAFYPHPEQSLAWWKVGVAAVVLVVITLAVFFARRKRYLPVGWLWFLVALAPTAGIVQVGSQAMADRYAYLPFIGIFIMVVWLVADLAVTPVLRSAAMIVVIAALAGFSWTTRRQISFWHDSVALFSHAEEVTPLNSLTQVDLGESLYRAGRPDLALPHAINAVRLAPGNPVMRVLLADALRDVRRYDESVGQYQIALGMIGRPQVQAQVRCNLALAFIRMNRRDDAFREFSAALRLDPWAANAYYGRGLVQYETGRLDAAIEDFGRSAQISPQPYEYYWLGRALEDKGNIKAAVLSYQAALKLSPQMNEARARLEALQNRLPR